MASKEQLGDTNKSVRGDSELRSGSEQEVDGDQIIEIPRPLPLISIERSY